MRSQHGKRKRYFQIVPKRTLELFSLIAGTQTRTRNPQRSAAACSDGGRTGVGRCSCFACLHKLLRDIKHHLCEGANHGGPLLSTGDQRGARRPLVARHHACSFKLKLCPVKMKVDEQNLGVFLGFFFLLRGWGQLSTDKLTVD